MFDSLCSNYKGSKKVRAAKATILVQQYELFMMKEDENIETMYRLWSLDFIFIRKTM